MHDFFLALTGGAMIGLASVILMASHGKILGTSGILSLSLTSFSTGYSWRISFILGVWSGHCAGQWLHIRSRCVWYLPVFYALYLRHSCIYDHSHNHCVGCQHSHWSLGKWDK